MGLKKSNGAHPNRVILPFLRVLESANKVYGGAPNEVPLEEQETRWVRGRKTTTEFQKLRIERTLHFLTQ
jgi:hypothetical protein